MLHNSSENKATFGIYCSDPDRHTSASRLGLCGYKRNYFTAKQPQLEVTMNLEAVAICHIILATGDPPVVSPSTIRSVRHVRAYLTQANGCRTRYVVDVMISLNRSLSLSLFLGWLLPLLWSPLHVDGSKSNSWWGMRTGSFATSRPGQELLQRGQGNDGAHLASLYWLLCVGWNMARFHT